MQHTSGTLTNHLLVDVIVRKALATAY